MHDGTTFIVLAAVSFDETGELALQEAARIAVHHGRSELHAVHVLSDHVPSESYGDTSQLRAQVEDAQAQLRVRVERLTVARNLRVEVHIRAGAAVRSILELAAEIDADLVVVGTDRHMRLRKYILGSVAESVLRESHCPVLVAMRKDHPTTRVRPAQLDHVCPAYL